MRLSFAAVVLSILLACNEPTGTPGNPATPTEDLLVGEVSLEKNPYGTAPLTAEATFTTRIPTRVTLTVAGAEPVTQTFAEATEHRIPILGLYPDTENEVTLSLESSEGGLELTRTVQTDPLPAELPTIDILKADKTRMEPGWNLVSFRLSDKPDRALPFMFDPEGAVRWYLDLPESGRTTSPERAHNGNLIFGFEDTIYEYTMLGEEKNEWDISGYSYHHDIVEKPDGNLIIAVAKEGLATLDDFAIELDRSSGEIIREWDFRQVFDQDRQTFDDDKIDWLHVNALWYDVRDDTLIVSGRVQGLAKVTMDNELVWLLAPHKGWGDNGAGQATSEYLMTAVDENGSPCPEAVQQGDETAEGFSWSWGQHAPLILPSGNLFVFDNGDNRNFTQDGSQNSPQNVMYSRGVEYAVDEAALSVKQVWQYGQERGSAFYSPIVSDVDLLPQTGNRLITPGIINNFGTPPAYSRITEVTYPGKELVFEAKLNFKNLFEGESVYGDSVYRSERLQLYPPVQYPAEQTGP